MAFQPTAGQCTLHALTDMKKRGKSFMFVSLATLFHLLCTVNPFYLKNERASSWKAYHENGSKIRSSVKFVLAEAIFSQAFWADFAQSFFFERLVFRT
jgi:hypothetical protein